MKVYSLIFDYNLDKMLTSGRIWGKQGYKNSNHIFEYSAASVATFLHHNSTIQYDVFTDNPELFTTHIEKYAVKTSNLNIIDIHEELTAWKQHHYCFQPAIECYQYVIHKNPNELIVKLDNDLTCLAPLDERITTHSGAIVWKYERLCSRGRHYWGESVASQRAFGTSDFDIHNIGVFSLSNDHKHIIAELPIFCEKLTNTDVSDVLAPEIAQHTKIWSCSEQTAYCYLLKQKSVPILQAYPWFDHHCYTNGKQECIERAKHLLKK